MGEEGARPARDVKNHLLFEIATEVAHRGVCDNCPLSLETFLTISQLVESILSSSPRPQLPPLNMAIDIRSLGLSTTNL